MLGRRDLPVIVAGIMLIGALSAPAAFAAKPECTQFGTAGDDVVDEVPVGTVYCGLEGADRAEVVKGTFIGGPDDDWVQVTEPRSYLSSPCVAKVYGGAGDDTVWDNCGTFEGGPGDDKVRYNLPFGDIPVTPVFLGGSGDDCVAVNGGIIDSAVLDDGCGFSTK